MVIPDNQYYSIYLNLKLIFFEVISKTRASCSIGVSEHSKIIKARGLALVFEIIRQYSLHFPMVCLTFYMLNSAFYMLKSTFYMYMGRFEGTFVYRMEWSYYIIDLVRFIDDIFLIWKGD